MTDPSSDADQAEQIANRMAALRGDVDRGLANVADSARRLTDWRSYLKHLPLVVPLGLGALGALAARRRGQAVAKRAVEFPSAATKLGGAPAPRIGTAATIATSLVGMAGPVLARVAMAYAGQKLQQWLDRRDSRSSGESREK